MAQSLAGKVIFVTGASAGIGAACARAFADLGARLLLLARRGDRLLALEPELRQAGAADVRSLVADVRDFDALRGAYEGLPPAWREVEVLVNNAGLSRGLDPLQSGKLEDWNEMIDTNIKGLLHVDRVVLPGMVERGARHRRAPGLDRGAAGLSRRQRVLRHQVRGARDRPRGFAWTCWARGCASRPWIPACCAPSSAWSASAAMRRAPRPCTRG